MHKIINVRRPHVTEFTRSRRMFVEVSTMQALGVGLGVGLGLLLWACQRACEPTEGTVVQMQAERREPFVQLEEGIRPRDGVELIAPDGASTQSR